MKLVVIVPVHNELANIRPFYARARKAMEALTALSHWEVFFVNDASDDGSLEEILALRAEDPRIKVISLSRDFGYHASVVAGLTLAEGDYYAVVDADGEDPPELLATFYTTLQQGAQVAYGIRSQRDEPRLVTFGRKIFYYLNRQVADSEIVVWMAEFAMMTKQVRDAILAPKTTFPFLRAEMGYVGFRREGVTYRRAKRMHGRSHYNFWRMTKFAIGGILSSSTFPLRFILYLAAVVAVAFPVVVLLLKLSPAAAAWLAAILTLYFVLMSVPFIALYVARTYKNGVARPVFVIDQQQTYL